MAQLTTNFAESKGDYEQLADALAGFIGAVDGNNRWRNSLTVFNTVNEVPASFNEVWIYVWEVLMIRIQNPPGRLSVLPRRQIPNETRV
jgi:hypothetical protein